MGYENKKHDNGVSGIYPNSQRPVHDDAASTLSIREKVGHKFSSRFEPSRKTVFLAVWRLLTADYWDGTTN